jgi:hypothetical protein
MTFYYANRVGFRLTTVKDNEVPDKILQQFPGDYLVRLPHSEQKEQFWVKVQESYPEIGPKIFDLKSTKMTP